MKVRSKQPRKQRKALYNAKNHQRSKLMTTRLADFLQEEYGVKRVPLRVGDQVRIVQGAYKDFEGEVLEANTKMQRVKIKEAVFDKVDGTQFNPLIHTSKLIITRFRAEKKMDPWRASIIERKAGFFGEEELEAPKKGKEKEVKE